jgi:hypothetical protein
MSYSSGGGGASFLGSSFLTYFLGSYFLASTLAAGAGALEAASTSLILYLNINRNTQIQWTKQQCS